MQDPSNFSFKDPSVGEMLRNIYNTSLELAHRSRQYNILSGIVKNLASIHTDDRQNILSLLAPERQSRQPSGKRDASRYIAPPKGKPRPAFNPSNPDCPYCPDEPHVPALKMLEQMHSTDTTGEAELPSELFEGEAKTVAKPKTLTFKDGETVEEVLQAHGKGQVEGQEVRQRLLNTIEGILKHNPDFQHLEYDRRWGVEKLAGLILRTKGIDPNLI